MEALRSTLIEATHVALGGEVGTNNWAFPYLDEQHVQYNMELLTRADALLLGRQTYEHLSVAVSQRSRRRSPPDVSPVRATLAEPKAGLSSRAGRALRLRSFSDYVHEGAVRRALFPLGGGWGGWW